MITFLIAVACFIAGGLSWAGVVAWAQREKVALTAQLETQVASGPAELKAAWDKLKAIL